MKIGKKFILGIIVSALVATPVPVNLKTVSAATTNTIKLVHGAYVYSKKGKRLRTYLGSKYKTHFHEGAVVKYTGKVEPIQRNSKHFYLLDNDNYNQSWLPYKKVKGSYYYSIGHGGYINAANVKQVNGQPLYISETTVKADLKAADNKPITLGTDNKVTIKNNQSIKVDYVASDISGNGTANYYHISNTKDAFIVARYIKTKPRQRLATQTEDTYIEFIKPTIAYNFQNILNPSNNSKVVTIDKDLVDYKQVIELLYIWVPQNNKAELFYRLGSATIHDTVDVTDAIDNNLFYIKAENVKYVSGPQLTPINTAEEAKEDIKVATEADKQDLQKAIAQEAIVKAAANYKNEEYSGYADEYDNYLAKAKEVYASKAASGVEVKQALWLLNKAQQTLLNMTPEKANSDLVGKMPAEY
ncbi:SLAP domain-containing protein [Lactobacillus sp. ESL0791]|uniref:SLAP domain-containing protein n=1 Tax=Lactobacillus sp. ESL0791 TaxID=2983234 RepID=UPI0023F6A2C5|nr:SLAP domain-containing protein [Lactobacillus sp. ESL0791]MDF7638122.1 SLAP domain-containing protein [Lactobacillus sp. ESL0791]